MDELMRRTTAKARVATILVGTFAAASLLIALVGIGGVLSYAVTLRRRELGVRAAIGATPATIARLVLSEAVALVGTGAALGLLLAAIAAPALEPLLFEIGFLQVGLLAGVVAAVALSSVAAVAPAAVRAARTDPARVLRG
jgi:ABC-type antimicrobial peptide transport system permease subunit